MWDSCVEFNLFLLYSWDMDLEITRFAFILVKQEKKKKVFYELISRCTRGRMFGDVTCVRQLWGSVGAQQQTEEDKQGAAVSEMFRLWAAAS